MERLALEFDDVSIRNGVEVVPVKNTFAIEKLAKEHEMIILGSEYLFKMNVQEVRHSETSFYYDFKNWVSYVLFAGIIKLALKKSKIDLKIGLSLTDYYQNNARFGNLIRRKTLNYYTMGIRHRKTIEFLNVDLYPNIYAQGLFLQKVYGTPEFVVLSLSNSCMEGMAFNSEEGALQQKYVIGKGLDHYRTKFAFDLQIAMENGGMEKESIPCTMEGFFRFHLQKKVDYLMKENPDLHIFFICDKTLDPLDFERFVRMAASGNPYTVVDEGPNVSCHGLFETYSNSYHSKLERVSVAVNRDFSTFLCHKNHGFKHNTRRSVRNQKAISSFSV